MLLTSQVADAEGPVFKNIVGLVYCIHFTVEPLTERESDGKVSARQ